MKKGQRRRDRRDGFQAKRVDQVRLVSYGDSIVDENGHYVVQYDRDECDRFVKVCQSFSPHDRKEW